MSDIKETIKKVIKILEANGVDQYVICVKTGTTYTQNASVDISTWLTMQLQTNLYLLDALDAKDTPHE